MKYPELPREFPKLSVELRGRVVSEIICRPYVPRAKGSIPTPASGTFHNPKFLLLVYWVVDQVVRCQMLCVSMYNL